MGDSLSYERLFKQLSVKIENGQRKPNKAIMLLSVIDLIRCGYIDNNKIYIDNAIKEAFEFNWSRYVDNNIPSVWTPFWHMKTESFWHFEPIMNFADIDHLVPSGQTASKNQMLSVIKYAYLDTELFDRLRCNELRDRLVYVLKSEYL